MNTIKKHQRARLACRKVGGTALSINCDGSTVSRIQYLAHRLTQLFDVPANMGTVVRLAVAALVEDVDRTHKGLVGCNLEGEKYERVVQRERDRIMRANAGRSSPWKAFPVSELRVEIPEGFQEIVRRHHKEQTAQMLQIKTPEQVVQDYVSVDDAE